MDDLEKYVARSKKRSLTFARKFEVGYENFRVGFLLRQTREELGMTQEEVAQKLRTRKSAISRIENHAEDIRLSALNRYAEALGRKLHVVMQ